jgi:hypothetical protein
MTYPFVTVALLGALETDGVYRIIFLQIWPKVCA